MYAAAWFYGIDITIYAKEYATTGRNIVFKADESDANCNADRAMWSLSYHGNNHYNNIWTPRNSPCPPQHIANVKRYQSNLQSALDDYHNDYARLVSSSIVVNAPIPPHKLGSIREITCLIMTYVAAQLLEAGREVISEDQMADLCTQAEGHAMK